MPKIIHQDLRELGFCNRGAREFFDRHGINWQLLMDSGIEISDVEGIDDEMVKQVIDAAKKRLSGGTQ